MGSGNVKMSRAPMFINERHGHEWHRAEINQPELRDKTESDQGDQRRDVQQLRQAKSARDSESYHERSDAFTAIKIVILRRVNQIETGDPTDHSRGQNDRCKIDMSSLGNPRPDRRDGQREAKKKMGRGSEAFCERVEKNDGKGNRRENESQAIDERGREDKTRDAQCQQARDRVS